MSAADVPRVASLARPENVAALVLKYTAPVSGAGWDALVLERRSRRAPEQTAALEAIEADPAFGRGDLQADLAYLRKGLLSPLPGTALGRRGSQRSTGGIMSNVQDAGSTSGRTSGDLDHDQHTTVTRRHTTETKAAYKTTELMAYVAAVVAVLIASAIVDEADFGPQEAWRFITYLTIGYMVSRGLAKSGSRDPYDDSRDSH